LAGTVKASGCTGPGRFAGHSEVFVQPFPGFGPRTQVSSAGGARPFWNANGREIYYLQRNAVMAVTVNSQSGSFQTGKPAKLFEGPYGNGSDFAATPDGRQFVMIKVENPVRATHVNLVLNWMAESGARP
jgi:hypothetical protein